MSNTSCFSFKLFEIALSVVVCVVERQHLCETLALAGDGVRGHQTTGGQAHTETLLSLKQLKLNDGDAEKIGSQKNILI